MSSFNASEILFWVILDRVFMFSSQVIIIGLPAVVLFHLWQRTDFSKNQKIAWTAGIAASFFLLSIVSFIYGFLYFKKLAKEALLICIILLAAPPIARHFIPVGLQPPGKQMELRTSKQMQTFIEAENTINASHLYIDVKNDALRKIKSFQYDLENRNLADNQKMARFVLLEMLIDFGKDGISNEEWARWKDAFEQVNRLTPEPER